MDEPVPPTEPRVVSLVPSLTETVFALGAGPSLVGRTRFCIEPEDRVRDVPAVGGPKDPDIDRLLDLHPTLVVMGIEENRREDYDRLREAGVEVFVTHVRAVADVPPMIRRLGAAIGAPRVAQRMAREIEGAAETVRSFAPDVQGASGQRLFHVFCPLWRDPWMVASAVTYVADVLDRAGLPSLLHEPERPDRPPYRTLATDEIIETDPGMVLLPSEPYPFGPEDRDEILSWPIRASRDRRVHLIDGRMIAWYGARTASALHALSLLALQWTGVHGTPPPPPRGGLH